MFFGSLGAYSAQHLDALASRHEVVGVVCGLERGGLRNVVSRAMRFAGLGDDPCGAVARRRQVPRWFAGRDGARLEALTSSLAPDAICVAGYPWLLRREVWRQPRLGALNCHASLLPRHRGVLPLFWIYYHDDRKTGVTVHRVNDGADAGDIILQDAYPLARGLPVDRLSEMNAERGSRALLEALDRLQADPQCGVPQDDGLATHATRVPAGTPMVDWQWDVERVWHFLAGLCPRFIEPLRDERGRAVKYRSVLGYERSSRGDAVATVRRIDQGWQLQCHGGLVRLGR